jgi:hypothetical protein
MPRFFRPEVLFFLACLVALLLTFPVRGFVDPGCLWHIRVGDLILRDGFMWTDPFTYPFAGRTWIPQQWGGECLMALAHRAGGFDAMLLGFAVVVAALFTWVFRRLAAGGMGYFLAAAVAAFALVCAGFHFYVRPHMATIVFMAVTTGAVVDFDRGRVGVGRLWWLVPLYVIWTNIHGGMLGGVATLGLAVAGWGVLFLVRLDSPVRSWGTIWSLVGLVASCGLTMFVNPFGLEMQRTWFRIVGSKVMKDYVSEHSPLNLDRQPDQVVVAFASFYLLLLVGSIPTRPRVTWFLPLVWFALTVQGIRQGPLFIVVAVVVIADLWPHTVWHRLLRKSGDLLTRDPATSLSRLGWQAYALPALVVLSSLLLEIGRVSVPVIGSGWVRFQSVITPADLNDAIREYADSVPAGTPIYNDPNFGGYLIYFFPELKVFMDDRFELCGDQWLLDYAETVYHHPERFEDWYRQYRFERAIVSLEDPKPLVEYLRNSGKWREVARGGHAALFARVK